MQNIIACKITLMYTNYYSEIIGRYQTGNVIIKVKGTFNCCVVLCYTVGSVLCCAVLLVLLVCDVLGVLLIN